MASTKLYDIALTQFRQEAGQKYPDSKNQILLEEFLNERSNPHEAQKAAKELQGNANDKYGGEHGIPASWVNNIISNIGRIIDFGNFAMEGAPGPEGLAWTAVKIVLGAVQSNYALYTLFGTGLTDVCEVMLLVTHYDRLNEEETKSSWRPSEMVHKLFETVVRTYVAVFGFSFSVKRHLNSGFKARLRHAFQDCFGIEKSKFQGRLDDIAALKQRILESSEAVFQDKTFQQFQKIHGAIESTVKNIRGFETQLAEIAKTQEALKDDFMRGIQDIKSLTVANSPWGKAKKAFDKYTGDLKPLKQTTEFLTMALEKRHEGTCEWLMTNSVYNVWVQSMGNDLLCLCGQPGSGKSVVLASVFDHLSHNLVESNTVILYISCETIIFDASDMSRETSVFDASGKSQRGARIITNTLLHQLYSLAIDDHKDTELLEACNQVFENPKKGKQGGKQGNKPVGMKTSLPDFWDAFPELAKKLRKHVIIAVDAVNLLQDSEQETLFDDLYRLLDSKSQWKCRVIVACRSSTRFHGKILDTGERCTYIDVGGDNNRADKDLVLSSALKVIPGLTKNEQEQAKNEIMLKAGQRFDYITDIAIPFMREPFERPLSNRLAVLPRGMGDTYSEALHKMSPNYIALLRKALMWTILSPAPPRLEEIMEDYRGTYNQPSADDTHTEVDLQENSNFPEASQLEIEQFRTASGPFLQLDSSRYVKLQDPDPIWDFCFSSQEADKRSSDRAMVCPYCKSNVADTTTLSGNHLLSITEKEGHLELALISLRHLNHPLFQCRAGLIDTQDTKAVEKSDKAEQKQENNVATEKSQTGDETGEPTESQVKDELKAPDGDDEEPKDGYESERSEDDAQIYFPQAYDDNTYNTGEEDLSESARTVRYECLYWPYHLRRAEALWRAEERVGNTTWDAIMEELNNFVYMNRIAFQRWQMQVYQLERPFKPLHIASFAGNLCWVKQLLGRNEKPDELSQDYNALQKAAESPHRNIEILKALLERCGPDCDINTETKGAVSSFQIWIHFDPSVSSMRELLELGGDPTRVCEEKWNSFHFFAERGEEPEAFDLLFQHAGNEAGKCINFADGYGYTPLHVLLIYRRQTPLNILKAFVDKGADVNTENNWSERPLQLASLWGMVESLRIIQPQVQNIDDPDKDGDTALHQAAIRGFTECIQFLAENGADVNLKNNNDRTALHHAAGGGFLDSVTFLLEWPGSLINSCDKHKRTPLFLACSGYSPEAACLILDKLTKLHLPVAEINQPSSRNRTPLSQSCARALDEVVAKLAQYAKERDEVKCLLVNEADTKHGLTPLHHAASRGSVACVRELLAIDANVAASDKKGRTPLKIAYEYWTRYREDSKYEETISMLINKDPSSAVSDDGLVAMCAAHGSIRLLKQLQGLNADLSKADRYGWTPLDLARKNRHSAVEKFLKRQGAWAGLLPSRWLSQEPKVSIMGNGLQISYKGDATTPAQDNAFSISAERPLPAGLDVYYFEVTIKKLQGPRANGYMAIGFCTLDGTTIEYPGWYAPNSPSAVSWGYHSDDGSVRCGASSNTDVERNDDWRYGAGDIVGCGVDYTRQEIWFTRNGKKIEYVFSNVQGRLFPVLGLTSAVELETKFAGEFSYQFEETKEEVKEDEGITEST
ncbi:ankyrin repeat-containing domain protein [Xylaria sp. FL1042]|nr:ankyrin repeat-containing domain protein [Xylaria sp. FL1042]